MPMISQGINGINVNNGLGSAVRIAFGQERMKVSKRLVILSAFDQKKRKFDQNAS
jgi:hypothetical protein